MVVTHTWNLCSAFKVHTHSSKHTHTVNTHPEQWAAIYAVAPGEQLGFCALLKGLTLVVVLRVEESAVHSLPPTDNPCRTETRTHKLSITSPTLYH